MTQTNHSQDQGRQDHHRHKTRHAPGKKPRKPVKIKFLHVVAVLVAILLIWYLWERISPQPPKLDYTEFAQCLTEEEAVMYGAYWCSHCNAQKEMFGDAFSYVDYVECTEDPDACTEQGIEGFPSWIIDDELYAGQQPMERLASLTGCALPE